MIIWIASYPRSGNSFFLILLHHFYKFNHYDIGREKIDFNEYNTKKINQKLINLSGFESFPCSLEQMARSQEIFFIKTHELPQDNYPAIYLLRDGRDSLVSYAHFIQDIEPDEVYNRNFQTILKDLITEKSYFSGWSNHVLAWTHRQANTIVVRFEDLIQSENPQKIIDYALTQLKVSIPTLNNITPLPNFSDLNQIESKLFRRGKIGGWQEEMPLDLHNLFWKYHGEAMREVGYSRQSELSDTNLELVLPHFPEDIQKLIQQYENSLNQNEKTIQDLRKELIDKEETIQDLIVFRRFSLKYWDSYYVRPLLKKIFPKITIDFIKNFKKSSNKLTLKPQYFPRLLDVSKNYNSNLPKSQLPSISLVTPAYNQGQFIERTINSILKQNYPNLEYNIQDGGSDDGTLKILEQYRSRVNNIQSQLDTGQANAINLGFSQTTGEIMGWLNSDDLLLPGTLAYVGEYFCKYPQVDVVYGHRILIDEKDEEIGRWVLPPHDEKVLYWADYIPQETLFWRREIWETVGGSVDESFRFAMDWDLLLRFQAAGAKFVRLPRFLGAFRIYPQQKTQEWEAIGIEEMNRLRSHCHDRTVSQLEIELNIKPYLKKSWLYYQLARWGITI